MLFEKKYKTTSKMDRLFAKATAYSDLVDRYVENDNHHRAKQMSILTMQIKMKAWESVYEVYPKLRKEKVKYNQPEKLIEHM